MQNNNPMGGGYGQNPAGGNPMAGQPGMPMGQQAMYYHQQGAGGPGGYVGGQPGGVPAGAHFGANPAAAPPQRMAYGGAQMGVYQGVPPQHPSAAAQMMGHQMQQPGMAGPPGGGAGVSAQQPPMIHQQAAAAPQPQMAGIPPGHHQPVAGQAGSHAYHGSSAAAASSSSAGSSSDKRKINMPYPAEILENLHKYSVVELCSIGRELLMELQYRTSDLCKQMKQLTEKKATTTDPDVLMAYCTMILKKLVEIRLRIEKKGLKKRISADEFIAMYEEKPEKPEDDIPEMLKQNLMGKPSIVPTVVSTQMLLGRIVKMTTVGIDRVPCAQVRCSMNEFNRYLKMYFARSFDYWALDKESKGELGDTVLIRQLEAKQQPTASISHFVDRVVFEYGNVIDPVTKKRVFGGVFSDEVELRKKLVQEIHDEPMEQDSLLFEERRALQRKRLEDHRNIIKDM